MTSSFQPCLIFLRSLAIFYTCRNLILQSSKQEPGYYARFHIKVEAIRQAWRGIGIKIVSSTHRRHSCSLPYAWGYTGSACNPVHSKSRVLTETFRSIPYCRFHPGNDPFSSVWTSLEQQISQCSSLPGTVEDKPMMTLSVTNFRFESSVFKIT